MNGATPPLPIHGMDSDNFNSYNLYFEFDTFFVISLSYDYVPVA
jgi:hypothetical protein